MERKRRPSGLERNCGVQQRTDQTATETQAHGNTHGPPRDITDDVIAVSQCAYPEPLPSIPQLPLPFLRSERQREKRGGDEGIEGETSKGQDVESCESFDCEMKPLAFTACLN